ncbi:hypothetical protein MBGDF03_00704, partial [Thermoplasmatales archaeon SCGC AB-540-F20]
RFASVYDQLFTVCMRLSITVCAELNSKVTLLKQVFKEIAVFELSIRFEEGKRLLQNDCPRNIGFLGGF